MKMEMNLKISVQTKGHAAGTLGWFQEWLNRSELVIRKTRYGTPGMFLHEKFNSKGEENKENEGNTFICKPDSNDENCMYYDNWEINNIRYVHVIPTSPDWSNDVGLTNYPLTPACHADVEEFILKSVKKFAEWYENQ